MEELKKLSRRSWNKIPFTAINENDVYSSLDKIVEFI